MKAATGRLLITLALVLGTGVATVSADAPPLPHAFYGAVEINGSPAPAGTSVEARGESVRTGTAAAPNPLITAEVGRYGGAGPLDAKLIVQGEITNGSILSFYVDGILAEETAEWHSGRVSEVDLSITKSEPAPSGDGDGNGNGGGGGGSTPAPQDGTLDVTIGGTTMTFDISPTGAVRQDIAVTTADGRLTVLVAAGTAALDADGDPLSALSLNATGTSPPPPPDTIMIGIAYDFQPDGASFNPPLTLEWAYDPDALPEGVSEDDLMLAYYDAASGQWVELATIVDTAAHVLRASLSHFTHVAVCAPEPPPAEETSPPADTTPAADPVAPPESTAVDADPEEPAVTAADAAAIDEEEETAPVATAIDEEEETAEPVAPDAAAIDDEEAPAQPADSSEPLVQVEWPLIAAISIAVLLAVTFIVGVLRRRSY